MANHFPVFTRLLDAKEQRSIKDHDVANLILTVGGGLVDLFGGHPDWVMRTFALQTKVPQLLAQLVPLEDHMLRAKVS